MDYQIDHRGNSAKLLITLPEELIAEVEEYTTELFNDENALTAENTLVGQIRKGKQLKIDPTHEKFVKTMNAILRIAQEFITQFMVTNGSHNRLVGKSLCMTPVDVWSVHSFEHDYNPIHYHETPNQAGLSFTFYTGVPQQILDQEHKAEGHGPYGAKDGWLHFMHGEYIAQPIHNLRSKAISTICPKRGLLVMWPKWLPHWVTPFEGEGERRSIAGNIDVWWE